MKGVPEYLKPWLHHPHIIQSSVCIQDCKVRAVIGQVRDEFFYEVIQDDLLCIVRGGYGTCYQSFLSTQETQQEFSCCCSHCLSKTDAPSCHCRLVAVVVGIPTSPHRNPIYSLVDLSKNVWFTKSREPPLQMKMNQPKEKKTSTFGKTEEVVNVWNGLW